LVLCNVFAIAFIVVRAYEFGTLHCRWDTNAYGSIVWTLLGFHTTHLEAIRELSVSLRGQLAVMECRLGHWREALEH